ncbi:MAG: STAS domain-containing protein [Candidatus Latescibacteria bacterium]|jgi:anti-anti-sigma factor|nr:STAS domain-containing protein [Candidatus Latescibacterota bacterium]
MLITKKHECGFLIFRIHAERATITNIADDLRDALRDLFKSDPDSKALVDLSQVTHIDSAVIGALMVGVIQSKETDGSCAVIGASQQVRHTLDIAEISTVLPIFSSVEDAAEGEA